MLRAINNHFEDKLFSDTTCSTSRGALIAVMNIEIRTGEIDKIFIHQMDNEIELAQNFILKHSLPSKTLQIIHKQIQSSKQLVKQSLTCTHDTTPLSSQQIKHEKQQKQTPTKQVSQFQSNRNSQYSNRKSVSMSRSRSTTDITDRLYNQNRLKSKYLLELEQKSKYKQQKIEQQTTTHIPQINELSHLLASERKKNATIQQYLIELGNQQTLRKERAASIKLKQQLNDCSFKPSVNKTSIILASKRPQSTYSKSLVRNTSHAYDNLFKPALNKVSKQIMQNKAPFMIRQKLYEENKQAKMNKIYKQKKRDETIDTITGVAYFKPSGANYQPKLWNENKLDVGQYLYEKGRIKSIPKISQNKFKINKQSQQLVTNKQMKRIIWIFGELDSDQDGQISSKKINIQTIPDNILAIIMPILFQMQQYEFKLNLEDFKQAIQTLHKSLNINERSILYDYKTRR